MKDSPNLDLLRSLGIAVLLATAATALASQRSSVQTRAFEREHACPSTGQHRGKCPGYVIDHVEPLCADGADRPSNMQWQTVGDGKRKDVIERRQCRALRRAATERAQ